MRRFFVASLCALLASAADAQPPDTTFRVHLRHARTAAQQRNTEEAYRQLELAVAAGLAHPRWLTDEPAFAGFRAESRFTALLERVMAARYPCRTDATARQFDFWIGTWDVSVRGQLAGTNEIRPLLEQCLLLENWTGRGGEGKSINYYDRSLRKWRQVWVADNGSVLDYTGEFRDGAMRFQAVTAPPGGRRTLHKLTFFPIAPDTVRQLFEDSVDDGKTWTVPFDGLYVRKRG